MSAKRLWYAFYVANWLLILSFWWQGSSVSLLSGGALTIVALGRLAGLSAAYMILTQFFLMGRTPYLERVFGLDRLSRLHHTNGNRGLLLLLIHPVLLTVGYSSIAGVSLPRQFLNFLTDYEHVLLAAIAFALFILLVGVSIKIVRSKWRYESWYFVHLLAYLAVFLAFWHQIRVGEDLLGNRVFYTYWVALYLIVFGLHVVFRFIRPVYNLFKFQFRVSRIKRENYNTLSIYITGQDLSKFKIESG